MSKNYYRSGDWNLTCDSCSRKIKASASKHRWDGFIVCADCWEPRHSLDFIRARQDKISVPFARPIPTLEFVPVTYPADDYVYADYVDDDYFETENNI